MAGLPESEHCPTCGSPDFITVHRAWAGSFRIALRGSRRCADCDASYAPPTGVWFSACAILIGGIVFVGSVAAARFAPESLGPEENAACIGVTLVFALLALGALAVVVKAAITMFLWRSPAIARTVPQCAATQDDAFGNTQQGAPLD